LLQPRPVPATSFAEWLRSVAGPRTLAIGLALLVELLLLLLLLSLNAGERPGDKQSVLTVVNVNEVPEEAPKPPERKQPKQRPAPQRPATEQPQPPQPAQARAAPIVPTPDAPPPPAVVLPSRIAAAPSGRPVYGPPDTGSPSHSDDSERVGTAPNGEALYAASWYREPTDDELRGYLSTARGPGWGLIACRTAPDYRVEDCVGLDEYPDGAQIVRAMLAAAWELKVRPPRLGGKSLVGSWVRIRIDYGMEQKRR
jgi:protein TonB